MDINEYGDQIYDKEFQVCPIKQYSSILVMKTFATYLKIVKTLINSIKGILTLDLKKKKKIQWKISFLKKTQFKNIL